MKKSGKIPENIPAKQGPETLRAEKTVNKTERMMVSAKKVLVVSADITLFQRLKGHLSAEEYVVVCVQKSDQELKKAINECTPEIIVVDPEISLLHGVEVSLLIRQWTPTPILILTTAMTLENQVRALDLAAENYLSEPFDISLIATRIAHILAVNQPSESWRE
jgi:DNA-binding response OmpR family regulator